MNWAMFEAGMRSRAMLPVYLKRLQSATTLVSDWFSLCSSPYVAYSGGKDSQVILDLALHQQPGVTTIWHDEDWVLVPGFVTEVERYYQTRIIRVRERHAADEFAARYGFFPRCSAPRPVDFEADTWKEIMTHYQRDGVLIGLRKAESTARRMALKTPLRKQKDGLWHCAPLYDWRTEDVWTYIFTNNLLYHPIYRVMMEQGGIDVERARVGPLTAVRVWEFGTLEFIKQFYPAMWSAFIADNPEVRE